VLWSARRSKQKTPKTDQARPYKPSWSGPCSTVHKYAAAFFKKTLLAPKF